MAERDEVIGFNVVGLKRRGFGAATLGALRSAYRTMFRSGLRVQDALEAIRAESGDDPCVAHFADFIEHSQRGICR